MPRGVINSDNSKHRAIKSKSSTRMSRKVLQSSSLTQIDNILHKSKVAASSECDVSNQPKNFGKVSKLMRSAEKCHNVEYRKRGSPNASKRW